MQESSITVIGNLVADPQLRIVASGAPVCSFRVGVTPRHKDATGQWVDGTSMFLSVSCWRTLAENAHVTLHKGDRVLVIGRMRQRAYTTAAGEDRVVHEIDADMVAPDLTRHSGVLSRPQRRSPVVPAGAPEPQPVSAQVDGPAAAPVAGPSTEPQPVAA